MSFEVSAVPGLKGGHGEMEGLTAGGQIIEVDEHRHQVELDLWRFETGLSYAFDNGWDTVFRLPYLVKDQTADIGYPAQGDSAGREAAQRNNDIHHRTERYEGWGDAEWVVGRRLLDPFGIQDATLRIGLGVTLPFGATEPDPWAAGDHGEEHLHLQFGNGTFDPIVELYLGVPISEHWAWSVFGKAQVPLYENAHGYRGSPQLFAAPRVTWLPHKDFSASAGALAIYQGYAEWPSQRDENAGYVSVGLTLGLGYRLTDRINVGANMMLPFYDHAFQSEDTLTTAPVYSISVSVAF